VVHSFPANGSTHYGPGSPRQRHNDSATTAEAVRRAIQHSQESLRALASRYGVTPKTIAKWRQRSSVDALPTGPKQAKSTVLSRQDEAVVVAFRRRTLLPLDDCLYALQATIPHLIRSSLHRCLQRNGISQLPNVDGDKPAKKAFKACPIGFFHIDIAEVQTAEGKLYLFVGIDRTSQFAYVQLVEQATRVTASPSSRPFPTDPHVLTDNAIQFRFARRYASEPKHFSRRRRGPRGPGRTAPGGRAPPRSKWAC